MRNCAQQENPGRLPGMRIAVTLRISREVLSWAVVCMNPCSENLVPPAKKHIPNTSNKLLRIEPMTAGQDRNHGDLSGNSVSLLIMGLTGRLYNP